MENALGIFKSLSLKNMARPSNIILVLFLAIFFYLTFSVGLVAGVFFCIVPFILVGILNLIENPKRCALALFVVVYILQGAARYLSFLKAGVTFDFLMIGFLAIILTHSAFTDRIKWKYAFNWVLIMLFCWVVFCFLLLFNPLSISFEAWLTNVRWVAFYPFIIILYVPLVVTEINDIKALVTTLAVLTLLAVAKALWQKYMGFDIVEKYQLYRMGMSRTHIVTGGIRYFSFFTDAANFGACMGISTVIFATLFFYVKNLFTKIIYFIVAALAMYGLIISGTRSALFVPFVGAIVVILLCRKKQIIVLGIITIVIGFSLLKFTTIGNNNRYIRRMRTVFDTQDASLQVRKSNKSIIFDYMKDKPFGIGLGMGGHKARIFAPEAVMSSIATDSQFVKLYVEIGVVGLTLYLLMLASILIYGGYITFFKIRDVYLKGIDLAIVAMLAGVSVNAYVNEILLQFPNGVIFFTFVAILIISPRLDKKSGEEGAIQNKMIEQSGNLLPENEKQA